MTNTTPSEWPPSRQRARRTGDGITAWVLSLLAAGLTGWMAWIHLHLHDGEYQHIPKIGILFLLNAIGGFVLTSLLVLVPKRLIALIALLDCLFVAGTLAFLVASLEGGVFEFQEMINAPYVQMALGVESSAILVSALLTALCARRMPGLRRSGTTTR